MSDATEWRERAMRDMSDDTIPGGWPDAARPGVPQNPERDGAHWLQITSPEDSVMIAATWEAGLWSYPSVDQDYAPEELARLGDAVRYVAPCHTPAEVAALVEAARREEREANIAACQKAVPRAHTYASENADIYRAGDAARDRCIEAIRAALKETGHD
jgi:hypothetical protein